MSTRMTKVDWEIINEALALLEATDEDDPQRPLKFWKRVRDTRHKVWDKLR